MITLENYKQMQWYGADREVTENIWNPSNELPHDVKQWICMMFTLMEFGCADKLDIPREPWMALVSYVTGQPYPGMVEFGDQREEWITQYLKDLETEVDNVPF